MKLGIIKDGNNAIVLIKNQNENSQTFPEFERLRISYCYATMKEGPHAD